MHQSAKEFLMIPDRDTEMIFSDAERCLGCHGCELACAASHGEGDLFEAAASGKKHHSRIRVVRAGAYTVPVQCRQCDNAPCAIVCPTSAIRREGGRVVIHEKNCVGCKLCMGVCPFGAIAVTAGGAADEAGRGGRGVARKCDLCAGQREGGEAPPACVAACPTGAMQLVKVEAYRAALQEARAEELARAHGYLKFRKVK